MRIGQYIRHKKYRDVCVLIKDVFDYGHGVKVRGEFWNMAFVNSYAIGQKVNINFSKLPGYQGPAKKDWLGDWQILQDMPAPTCLRYGNWKPCSL